MASSLDPFKLLLNDLNNELNQRNLQSLIHVCGSLIPGGQRETINSGWQVFSILCQQNAIGKEPEKMKFLLRIIRELRPKRKDLVKMVKLHIQENYEQPEEILDDLESSSDGYLTPRPATPVIVDAECCSVRCGCCNCNCIPCCGGCCCCVILAILFAFFTAVAALMWYSDIFGSVHKYFVKHCDEDLFKAGKFIIGVLGFIAACCVSCGVYLHVKRRTNDPGYAVLSSAANDAASWSNRPICGSYAASDTCTTQTSCSAFAGRTGRQTTPECTCSTGRITASSSLASMGSSRTQSGSRYLWRGQDLETDNFSPVFTQEFDTDQESKGDDGSVEGCWNPERGGANPV